jgi:predicted dehydrogenase
MRFPSGIIATCSSSYGFHETRRYTVQGSDARLDVDPAFSYANLRLKLTRKTPSDPKTESSEERIFDPRQQFALEMDHMAWCVTEDKTPFTPGEEGLQDQRIMETIYRAAREGKSISLPPVGKKDAFRGKPPEPDA